MYLLDKKKKINDWVYLSKEEMAQFRDITRNICEANPISYEDGSIGHGLSGDIITANTIPLRLMGLCCADFFSDEPADFSFHFPNNDEMKDYLVTFAKGGEFVGEINLHHHDLILPIMCDTESNYLSFATVVYAPNRQPEIIDLTKVDARVRKQIEGEAVRAIMTWYGIQIALLNPYVKDVFRTETIRKTGFNPNGKKRKSIVKYVRHHYLNPCALSPDTETGQFLRKTMAWYVCGHWRHYQNGNTIFIQPYWKGPLRETKVCEPRERIVV